MASRFLDFSPPVATALKMGTPIVAIETGFFMRLPYPKNLAALQDCEQALWRRDCVPCCIGVVEGRLKAGLNKDEMDALCQAGGSCTRAELVTLVADRGTAGAGPSAALAIARMAGIVPVIVPGLTDSLADMDALSASARLAFCGRVAPDKALLYSSRSVPVLRQEDADALSNAFLLQRDMELSECSVVPCGDTLGDLADRAAATALELKKKVRFT